MKADIRTDHSLTNKHKITYNNAISSSCKHRNCCYL